MGIYSLRHVSGLKNSHYKRPLLAPKVRSWQLRRGLSCVHSRSFFFKKGPMKNLDFQYLDQLFLIKSGLCTAGFVGMKGMLHEYVLIGILIILKPISFHHTLAFLVLWTIY